MTISLNFLTKKEAQQHFVTTYNPPHSEYAKRMAMKVTLDKSAPSERAYQDFYSEQFLEWQQDEKDYFNKLILTLRNNLLSKNIDLGSLVVPLVKSSGLEYPYMIHLYGGVINIIDKPQDGQNLKNVIHLGLPSVLIWGTLQEGYKKYFLQSIFYVWLQLNPMLLQDFYRLLGFESITLDNAHPALRKRAILFQGFENVKMQVTFVGGLKVDVMPIYYYNEECKFDNKYKAKSLLNPDALCVSQEYIVIQKCSDGKYMPVCKNGELWVVTKNECDDPRMQNSKNFYGVNIFNVQGLLLSLLLDYVYEPKNLTRLKGPLAMITKWFDTYFLHHKMDVQKDELEENNDQKPLLAQFEASKRYGTTFSSSNATAHITSPLVREDNVFGLKG